MRLLPFAWKKTWGKLGKKAVSKRRKKRTRQCGIESLEPRRVLAPVYPYVWQLETAGNGTDCPPCDCSSAQTTRDGNLTVAGSENSPTSYNSGFNPHPIISVTASLPTDRSTAPDLAIAEWSFNGSVVDTVYYEGDGLSPGDEVVFSIQVDASTLESGSYPWELELFYAYDAEPAVAEIYTGFQDVINRLYSDPATQAPNEFGAGWYLPELDRLVPNGSNFNLITGENQSISASTVSGIEDGYPTFKNLSYNGGAGVYVAAYADGSESWFDDDTGFVVKRTDPTETSGRTPTTIGTATRSKMN